MKFNFNDSLSKLLQSNIFSGGGGGWWLMCGGGGSGGGGVCVCVYASGS